jgi:AraC-like DNA-binding protein
VRAGQRSFLDVKSKRLNRNGEVAWELPFPRVRFVRADWGAAMVGSFLTWEVADPHETTQSLAEHFPLPPREMQQYQAITYEAADWRRYKIEPNAYRTQVSVGLIGGVAGQGGLVGIAGFRDQAGTKFSIKSPGGDYYCLSFLQEGSGELCQSGKGNPARLDKECAAIFYAQPGTALYTSDWSARLNVWLPAGLVRRRAAALLGGSDAGDIDFDMTIDCRSGAGASLRRMTEFLLSELARPDSMLANPISAALAEELLLQSILVGLSHNRSALLRRQNSAAAPGNIRRAEEFIRSNADKTITIEGIARAAGCSVRALQLGFRRFRDTSPMSALRQARLDRARDEIVRSDGSLSVLGVATRHGFVNPGRFSDIYRQAYGEFPSETLRARALSRR